jgi:hypothetical protein
MPTIRPALLFSACIALMMAIPSVAGVATPHRLSFQGLARNAANQAVVSGDVRVRIYDAATAGTLVYDSGTEFNGAIVTGVFNVLLGGGAPLMLDNTMQYHLELDINTEEVIGDATTGRRPFWPAGGDQSRSDLEDRLATLEGLIFADCAAGKYDLNGNPADGCEFVLDTDAIYVDANDPGANDNAGCGRGPVDTCAGCQPCQTISRGLTEAVSSGRSKVNVANGTYAEAVTLVNGKSLLGGWRGGTWERRLASTSTILRGESASGNHRRAVVGTAITSPTVLEGFIIFGPQGASPAGNSYAVYLSNAGGLTVRNNVIYGGAGGPGADGSDGTEGLNGVTGTVGANAIQSSTSSCVGLDRPGGAGGVLLCGGTSVSGGAGGGNRCTPSPNSEFSGLDGLAAPGTGGGTGGDAGDDALLQSGLCTAPPNPTTGAPGGNGTAGSNGGAGSGASNPNGTVAGGHWAGTTGGLGAAGAFGRGGGGGGAGGGADGISPEKDVLGGAGGGGGSGACGGAGGTAGAAGGGSFGVFITGGTAPVITSNLISRGYAGPGGRGGQGGKSGAGGLGAAGGAATFFCAGAGGRGGDGGAGGHGGGAGGGAGGISVGIFTSGVGAPGYSAANTIFGGGSASGGQGGLSFGNSGTPGVAGSLSSVASQ